MRAIGLIVAVAMALAAPAAAHHGGEFTQLPEWGEPYAGLSCELDGQIGYVSTTYYCVVPHVPAEPTPAEACEADGEGGFVTIDGSCMTASAYDEIFATEEVPEPRQQEVAANPDFEEGPTVDEVLGRFWFSLSL